MNTNTDQEYKPKAKTAEKTVSELAAALRDVIQATPDDDLQRDPEEAYRDLACRLILKLARNDLTIVPAVQNMQTAAAWRCLDIFTKWLRKHPECSYVTSVQPDGRFDITATTAGKTPMVFCTGTSVQDAYAQAAQTINMNGGTL